MVSVPWGRTIWMLHIVNHGGAFPVQYSLSPATKGGRGGVKVAAATLLDLKLEGLGFPLPTRPKWHMSTWAPYSFVYRSAIFGPPLTIPASMLSP